MSPPSICKTIVTALRGKLNHIPEGIILTGLFHEVIPGADKRAASLGAAFQRVHNGVAVGVAKRSRLKLCHRGALLLSVIFKCQKIGQIF